MRLTHPHTQAPHPLTASSSQPQPPEVGPSQALNSARSLPSPAFTFILTGSLAHTFSSKGLSSGARDPDSSQLRTRVFGRGGGRLHRQSPVLPQGTAILPQVSRIVHPPAHVPAGPGHQDEGPGCRALPAHLHHGCDLALFLLLSTSLLLSLLLGLGTFWWGFLHVWVPFCRYVCGRMSPLSPPTFSLFPSPLGLSGQSKM